MKHILILCFSLWVTGCNGTANNTSIAQDIPVYDKILQLLLNVEPFQEHFINTLQDTSYPLIIADNEIRGVGEVPEIYMFGKPVHFMEKSVVDSSNNA